MELEKFAQKNPLESSRFIARSFVVGVILSITFFLLLIDSYKVYRSDVYVLVNVKSQALAKNQDQLIGSLVELPKTLSFYDRLLKFNPDVRDVAKGLSPLQKKEKWNEMVSTSRVEDNTSVIKISVATSRQNDSEQLAIKTARTLFDTTAFYYNIKSEVSMRIIDGPLSTSDVPGFFWIIVVSIIAGFAISTSLSFFLTWPGKFFDGKNKLKEDAISLKKNFFDFKKGAAKPAEEEIESLKHLYETEQFNDAPFVFESKEEEYVLPTPQELVDTPEVEVPEKDTRREEMKKLTKQIEPDKYPNFPEMPVRGKKSASAPDNLPVADENFFTQENIIQQNIEIPEQSLPEQTSQIDENLSVVEAEEKKDMSNVEPTEEELKKRLNQLLRGEL